MGAKKDKEKKTTPTTNIPRAAAVVSSTNSTNSTKTRQPTELVTPTTSRSQSPEESTTDESKDRLSKGHYGKLVFKTKKAVAQSCRLLPVYVHCDVTDTQ